jgi:circadian clock protein KaiC
MTLPRTSTGIAGLDDILLGGWPANHLYLIEGAPGSGKTTLALQFLLEGARIGEKVLYITLAESKDELESVAASHGMLLNGVQIHEFAPTEESLRKENEYSALYPSEVEFHDTMQSILEKVNEIRPARLVFDSLSEIRILARDSLRYRRQVLAMKHFFLNRSTTVLMLDEPPPNREDLQLQTIAHGVLSLARLERDYGVDRRRLRISKLRGSSFRQGFHDYVIQQGGLEVYPRLVASEHRELQSFPLAQSGIAALDEMWGGGIPMGTSTAVKGPAGAGKSTIVTRYAYQAASQGINAALFQFDESHQTTLGRSRALGMDLEPLIKSGHLEVKQFDPAEVSPGQFIAHVRDAVEKRNTRVLAIDTVNGFLNAMLGEQRLLLQMHELCMYLNQQGVLTFLIIAQSGVVGPQNPEGVDLSYLADNVMLLNYFEAFGEVKKAIAVLKMRVGWHEPTIRELRFGKGSFSIGEPLRNFHGILGGIPTFQGSPTGLDGVELDEPAS